MFILSPEQVKFNQDGLQERFLLDTAQASRGNREPSNYDGKQSNMTTPLNEDKMAATRRKNSHSRTLQRNLDAELSQISSSNGERHKNGYGNNS